MRSAWGGVGAKPQSTWAAAPSQDTLTASKNSYSQISFLSLAINVWISLFYHSFIDFSFVFVGFLFAFFAHLGDRFCPPLARMVSWQIGDEDQKKRTNFPTHWGIYLTSAVETFVPFIFRYASCLVFPSHFSVLACASLAKSFTFDGELHCDLLLV